MSDRLYQLVSAERKNQRGRRSSDQPFYLYLLVIVLIFLMFITMAAVYLGWKTYTLEKKLYEVAAEQALRTPFVYPNKFTKSQCP